jgi:cysteine synthase
VTRKLAREEGVFAGVSSGVQFTRLCKLPAKLKMRSLSLSFVIEVIGIFQLVYSIHQRLNSNISER